MPTYPKVKLTRLKDVNKGSLVGAADRDGTVLLGLRVAIAGHHGGPEQAALVVLTAREDKSINAIYMPTYVRHGMGWAVSGDSWVVDHSDNWTIEVEAKDWTAHPKYCPYGEKESGLLLLNQKSELGMAVCDGSNASYLGFADWILQQPGTEDFVSARRWYLSRPAPLDGREWPFGRPL